MLRGVLGSGGGAAVGGGGTSSPSTIPRWTGASTLGDSALVQPSGTTRMYAASNDASTYLHLYGGNDDTLPVLATLNNTNPATATFGWGFFNRSTDGNLQLSRKASSTTWSQVVTFERSTGNVGIGTASPDSRLHVNGTAARLRVDLGGGGNNYYDAALHYFRSFASAAYVTIGPSSLDASATSGYGIKLPATPGNPDTQTLDCYQENAVTTTGVTFTNITTSAGAVNCQVNWTRLGRGMLLHLKLYPDTGATLTISANWTVNLSAVAGLPTTFTQDTAVAVAQGNTSLVNQGSAFFNASSRIIYGQAAISTTANSQPVMTAFVPY